VATLEELRKVALSLPGATEGDEPYAFGVDVRGKVKGFAWTWKERVVPKRPRVPNLEVIAIRTAGAEAKEDLLRADPAKFFTEAHYNGFPAVLVRLAAVDLDELTELLTDAHEAVQRRR
jgi:hypothetical protein